MDPEYPFYCSLEMKYKSIYYYCMTYYVSVGGLKTSQGCNQCGMNLHIFSELHMYSVKLSNKILIHTLRVQEGMLQTSILCRMRVFCTYIVWYQLTQLHGRWRYLCHIYTNVRTFWNTIVYMSEYSLMGKYSITVCRTLILCGVIGERYVDTGNLSWISLLSLLDI